MSDSPILLKNLSVTLFAYHLCHDLSLKTDQLRHDADNLWEWISEIGQANKLNVSELEELSQKIKTGCREEFYEHSYYEILGESARELQVTIDYPLTVSIYPVKIHDTYALDLTLDLPEINLSPQVFKDLNPGQMFLPNSIPASLGKTLLLYAEPINNSDLNLQVAHACVDSFLGTIEAASLFIGEGRLLNGQIFEYDNLEVNPCKQIHILVWLIQNPNNVKIGNLQQPFMKMLCCRSKILFASHSAKTDYFAAREVNSYLEKLTEEFPSLANSKKRLKQFKKMLEAIPPQSFAFDCYLRSLSDHYFTVENNAKNYIYNLEELKRRSSDYENLSNSEDLNVFQDFYIRIDRTYLPQIQSYINYLAPGKELYSKMLESIRGLVEIEEAERDRRLEDTLQKISLALGFGGLVASSSPSALQEKPFTLFSQQQPYAAISQLHPFIFSSSIIFIGASMGWLIASLLILIRRKK